ncbi:MAG TPA: DUF5615 family PIN-like protein [Solirubrobacterales bacterium]|nr:DUF5615 family PIN-like protein [Solirubrobacterales bacterium]
MSVADPSADRRPLLRAFPDEIDRRITLNTEDADEAEAAWKARTGRLGVKLLLDEQISGKVAERLRDRGHDVTAATDDPSLRGLRDPDLFEVAQQQDRALVTYNRVDFEPIIREYASSGSTSAWSMTSTARSSGC